MHQTISQRRAILDGLRDRGTMATSEFYAKAGITQPVQGVRFIVMPRNNSVFVVVERSTGKHKGLANGHASACALAQRLEDADDAMDARRSRVRELGRNMLGWTMVIAVALAALTIGLEQ